MIPFTILTASKQVLMTKVMSLNADGALNKSTRANLSRGSYQVKWASNLESLASELSNLNSSQCVTWGQPGSEAGLVCTQDDDVRREQGAIPRDRKHFAWNSGLGILMLDHDGTPGRSLTGDEFRELLLSVCPNLATAPMLWRPSVSAGLVTAEGHELTKLDRHRLYIPVTDARRVPEAGKALESLLWAAGHGWCELSSSGQRLLRCPVDTSVWQPERIDFCAPPELRDGIRRPESTHRVYGDPSGLFDLGALIDSVDSDVKSRAQAERRKARNAKQDEANEVALVWAEKQATSLGARRGIKIEQALLCLTRAATTRVLMGDFELTASDGAVVSVGEILDQPARWHGKRFYDPLDPDEDNRVAVAKLIGTRPTIFSHRHGGVAFELRRQASRIQLGRGMRIEATDNALAVLRAQGDAYDFGSAAIAYVTSHGRVVVPNRNWLTDHLGRMCEFFSLKPITDKDGNVTGEKEFAEDSPFWLADAILAKHGERGFATLTGVVTAPTLRPDGSVLDTPGYDTATQLC